MGCPKEGNEGEQEQLVQENKENFKSKSRKPRL